MRDVKELCWRYSNLKIKEKIGKNDTKRTSEGTDTGSGNRFHRVGHKYRGVKSVIDERE